MVLLTKMTTIMMTLMMLLLQMMDLVDPQALSYIVLVLGVLVVMLYALTFTLILLSLSWG